MWFLARALRRIYGREAAPTWFVSVLYAIIASMTTFLAIWENGDRLADHVKSAVTFRKEFEEFDFIIVGGGSAGAVMAHRLSENQDWNILLIEAGGEPHPLQTIPLFSFLILNYPEVDWMHKTVPQKKSCFGLKNNQSGWSQGKSLGGTGNINFMLHFRGNPQDFNNWANLTEDPSWNYENVLHYFKKSEDYSGEWNLDETHGIGGPLRVQQPDFTGIASAYVKAGEDMGYNNTDLNGYYTEGFDTCYYGIKNGRRQATYKAYIQTARKRKNLTIYKYAHVNKILIKEETKEAYGVQYDRQGERRYAFARKEIILSAGVVQSPKILMLSGIGPSADLKKLEITPIADLPVGKNLQDHISTYLGPFEMSDTELYTSNFDTDVTPQAFYEYSTKGTGPLTTSGVHASGIFTSSYAKARGEADWPDIQLYLVGVSPHRGIGKHLSHAFHLKEKEFTEYYNTGIGKNSFIQVVSLGRPKSRGEMTLAKNDPYVEPIIDPKYLEVDEDFKILLEATKKAVYLAENTTTFKKHNTKFTSTVLPGCENIPFKSDLYWECYIRTYSITLHHIVGTCAMGKNTSSDSVVDTQLRVIGVKRLRVIDASVMPIVPVSNTQAPTIMIAEKGADMIKQMWNPEQTTTEVPLDTSTTASTTEVPLNSRPNPTEVTANTQTTELHLNTSPSPQDVKKNTVDPDLNFQFVLPITE